MSVREERLMVTPSVKVSVLGIEEIDRCLMKGRPISLISMVLLKGRDENFSDFSALSPYK